MKQLKRIRGAIGIGLTWALGWACAGRLIGVSSVLLPGLPWDSFFAVFDAPLPVLAITGLFAGVFFSAVLSIAARRLTLRELSLQRVALWGASGGVLVTAFPIALEAGGLARRERSNVGALRIMSVLVGPFGVLSALSAVFALKFARFSERLIRHDGSEFVPCVIAAAPSVSAHSASGLMTFQVHSNLQTADAKPVTLHLDADRSEMRSA